MDIKVFKSKLANNNGSKQVVKLFKIKNALLCAP